MAHEMIDCKPFTRKEKVLPYHAMAAIYDQIMDHVDYRMWANYISSLFRQFGNHVTHIVEGGCGTGRFAAEMVQLGYHIVGFDLSLPMIREAGKATDIPLWQGDLRYHGLSGKWDTFLCLYDTIQYLSLGEINKLLINVHQILSRDGLFIFDVVTESSVKKYWYNFTEKCPSKSGESIRRSWYDRKKRCLNTEFDIYFRKDKKKYHESHCQYVYSVNEIKEVVRSSGFKLLGWFHDFTLQQGNSKSDRVHFVLQQEAS